MRPYQDSRPGDLLTLRDPRAAALAKRLAEAWRTTMTQAVVTALEQALRRNRQATPLAMHIRRVAPGRR